MVALTDPRLYHVVFSLKNDVGLFVDFESDPTLPLDMESVTKLFFFWIASLFVQHSVDPRFIFITLFLYWLHTVIRNEKYRRAETYIFIHNYVEFKKLPTLTY